MNDKIQVGLFGHDKLARHILAVNLRYGDVDARHTFPFYYFLFIYRRIETNR
jgi:hypothetical protein